MFLVIVTTIWTLIHAYTGWRIVAPLKATKRAKVQLTLGFVSFAFMLPLTFVFGRLNEKPVWHSLLDYITFAEAGFVLLLFPLLVVKDLVSGAVRQFPAEKTVSMERRRFLANSFNFSLIGLSGAFFHIGHENTQNLPETVRVDIPIAKLHKDLAGFKIAQITDTHLAVTKNQNLLEKIVETVNSLDPDIICFTGDIADGYAEELRETAKPLKNLKSKYGTYYVTGNHEYYWNCLDWIEETKGLGFTPLINENKVIEHGNAKIVVAGVTDFGAGKYLAGHKTDPPKALHGAPACDIKIMLAHQPRSAPDVAKTGADLQISGHTHGGQFFPWNLLIPLFHPVGSGLSRYKGMWVYVSRGTGYWGPPLRLGAPPEITLLTLKRQMYA